MIIGSNQVMEKSNLTSRYDNHDYDGDSLISLALHSEQARNDFRFAYAKNLVEFEHMDELLIDYEHEAIYSAFMLTKTAKEKRELSSPESDDRDFSLKDINYSIDNLIKYPGEIKKIIDFKDEQRMTPIEIIINQLLLGPIFREHPNLTDIPYYGLSRPIYLIDEHGVLNKKGLMKLTDRFWLLLREISKYNETQLNFWDIIHEFDKFLLECSGSISYCIPSFNLGDFVVKNDEITDFKNNLISVEPFVAFHQNLILFEKISDEISKNEDNILNLVFKSGARLKSVQLLKAASNTGIPTDIYGKAFPANIKNSLLDGLSPEEYFITGDSARLALAVRQEAIPKGGELQRKFFFATGILKLAPDIDDCQSDTPLENQKTYDVTIKNWDHLKLLNHRYYIDDHPSIPGEKELFIIDLDTDDENIIESYKELIGKTIKLRSPVTCRCSDYRICKTCFGDKLPESVNLGSTVGAALSEGIIQSVLRAHHFGGAFIATEDQHLLDILRRSVFRAPDKIINDSQEDIDYIIKYLYDIYPQEDIEFQQEPEVDGTIHLTIKVNELPFNDDSVKQLNNIVGLIDKNRDASSLIDPAVLYNELELVIEQNNILSVYLELIISLLYYDEDGILYRYTDKEPNSQIALKNIIEVLDPKLSIFYNFSNRVISKIYNHQSIGHVDHMYRDLLDIYK